MKKIYILDNDIFTFTALESYFSSKNIQVHGDSGHHEFLHSYNNILAKQPDLLIMELLFPGLDAFELLEKIKSSELTFHLPVYVYTGSSNLDHHTKARNKNIEHIFWKKKENPINLADKIVKIHKRELFI